MPKRTWLRKVAVFTLLDQVPGLMYWGLAIYGIFQLMEHAPNTVIAGIGLVVYLPVVTLAYIKLSKFCRHYLKARQYN